MLVEENLFWTLCFPFWWTPWHKKRKHNVCIIPAMSICFEYTIRRFVKGYQCLSLIDYCKSIPKPRMQHGQVLESTFHIYKMWQFSCPPQFWTFCDWLALWASNLLTLSSRERFAEIKKRMFVKRGKLFQGKILKIASLITHQQVGLTAQKGAV